MWGLLVILLVGGMGAYAQSTEKKSQRPDIVKPKELLKCKPKGPKEEAKVREAAEAANLSDHEVFARLIYAESLSTGFWAKRCDAPGSEALMEAIAWGIVNRVDKYSPRRDDPKPDAYYQVIFGQKQFRTSFAAKDNAYAVAYLCPLNFANEAMGIKNQEDAWTIYLEAKEVAARVMTKYQQSGFETKYSKITHFFYPQSDFGGKDRPAWAKDPDPTKNRGYMALIPGAKPCAEFYSR